MRLDDLESPDAELPPTRSYYNGMADVRVSEVYDEELGGRVLWFRTDFGERKALVYPENWLELTDEQLQRISDRVPD